MTKIVYGTHVFTKFKGFYGISRQCANCGRIYKQSYVKYSTWAHLEYIPLFPVKIRYAVMCPVCGYGIELKSKEAKAEMQDTKDENQRIDAYAVHFLLQNSYGFFVRDLNTNEEICIATGLKKGEVKKMKKSRGLKNFQFFEVQG